MEKFFRIGELAANYGAMLSEKQRSVVEQYYLEDLSINEIATNNCITKQGAYDVLKRAEKRLLAYEEKLGVLAKFSAAAKSLDTAQTLLDEVLSDELTERNRDALKRVKDELAKVQKNL